MSIIVSLSVEGCDDDGGADEVVDEETWEKKDGCWSDDSAFSSGSTISSSGIKFTHNDVILKLGYLVMNRK